MFAFVAVQFNYAPLGRDRCRIRLCVQPTGSHLSTLILQAESRTGLPWQSQGILPIIILLSLTSIASESVYGPCNDREQLCPGMVACNL